MATTGGPNIERDGLVFGYDTNYGVADNSTATRFYPGEKTVNLLNYDSTMPAWPSASSNMASLTTKTSPRSFTVIGTSSVAGAMVFVYPSISTNTAYHTISATFTNNSTETCAVTLYIRGYSNATSTVNQSSTITLQPSQSIRRTLVGNVLTVNGGYTAAVGVFSHGTSGQVNMNVTDVQFEEKTHATPFVNGTRSSTASLIDLKRTTSIDVSNVSFDSTGQPEFDGTDDYINMGDLAIIKLGINFTIEAVVKPEQDKWMYFFHKGYGQNNSLAWGRHSTNDNWFFATMINGSYLYSYMGTATLNQYCHLVASYDGTNLRLYENGDLKATVATTHDMMTSTQPLGIGGPDRYWNGEIPVTKVYSKALVQSEVKQNYNAYKNRFDI